MTLTRSRYRLYGGAANYARALRDLVLGAHRRERDGPALEQAFAEQFASPHAVFTSLARVAVHDLVRRYVPPGRGLLLSPYTIVDVVNHVVAAGARPVFVDVDPTTGNMCPEALARTLASASGADAAAVLVTHLHGVPADLDGLVAVARRAGLPLLEDAAQSMGARVDGRSVGTFGEAGVFSLGSYKNVNAHFGGVVLTADPTLAAWLRAERDARPIFPRRHLLRKLRESLATDLLGVHPFWGGLLFPLFREAFLRDWESLNRMLRIELDTGLRPTVPGYMLGRPTDLQARAACAQLPDIDAHARTRIAAAARYHAALDGHPDLVLPPPPDGLRNVYTYYAVQVRGPAPTVRTRRHGLLRALARGGRDVAAQHLHDVSALPDFRRFGGDCPGATRVAGAVVLLPTYPGYDARQIDANIAVIRAWRA
jgi:perosamine synthetase